jgi:hypothetical protein
MPTPPDFFQGSTKRFCPKPFGENWKLDYRSGLAAQFVSAARSGPLFTGLQADRFGNRGGNGTKTIGRWVRGLGLTDERLSPSHSWRHRFKTLGRQFGLAPDIVNAITGHLRKTVADSYGEFPMDALFREIAKIPAFDVT